MAGRVAGRARAACTCRTESPAHSIRAHGDWLLVGGESHKTGRRTRPSATSGSSAWARERFGLEPELRWATQDHMPRGRRAVRGPPRPAVRTCGSPPASRSGASRWAPPPPSCWPRRSPAASTRGRALFDPNRLRPRASAPTSSRRTRTWRTTSSPTGWLKRGSAALHAPRLPARLERRRGDLGLPLPRLPLRRERRGDRGPRRAAAQP